VRFRKLVLQPYLVGRNPVGKKPVGRITFRFYSCPITYFFNLIILFEGVISQMRKTEDPSHTDILSRTKFGDTVPKNRIKRSDFGSRSEPF
jgi:hypothetical protein